MIQFPDTNTYNYSGILGPCSTEELESAGITPGQLFLSSMPWRAVTGDSVWAWLGKIVVTFLSYLINTIMMGAPGMHTNALLNQQLDHARKAKVEAPKAEVLEEEEIVEAYGEVINEVEDDEIVYDDPPQPAKEYDPVADAMAREIPGKRYTIPGSKIEFTAKAIVEVIRGKKTKKVTRTVTKTAYIHYMWDAGKSHPAKIFVSPTEELNPKGLRGERLSDRFAMHYFKKTLSHKMFYGFLPDLKTDSEVYVENELFMQGDKIMESCEKAQLTWKEELASRYTPRV